MLKNNREIFKILSYKNEALSTKCLQKISFPLGEDDENSIFKLFDTLRYNKGVYEKRGLALSAPQVGIFKRFFVVGIGSKIASKQMICMINPEISDKSKETCEEYEGCLSIPKLLALVERPKKVIVKFSNLSGKNIKMELGGLDARVIQHEYDHLEGVHMLSKAKKIIDNDLYFEFKEKLKKKKIIYNSDEDKDETLLL